MTLSLFLFPNTAESSIEERILSVQDSKYALAAEVLWVIIMFGISFRILELIFFHMLLFIDQVINSENGGFSLNGDSTHGKHVGKEIWHSISSQAATGTGKDKVCPQKN